MEDVAFFFCFLPHDDCGALLGARQRWRINVLRPGSGRAGGALARCCGDSATIVLRQNLVGARARLQRPGADVAVVVTVVVDLALIGGSADAIVRRNESRVLDAGSRLYPFTTQGLTQ